MRKHLVTFGLLVIALALYAAGLVLPGTIFIVLGLVAEFAFWVRLLRRRS